MLLFFTAVGTRQVTHFSPPVCLCVHIYVYVCVCICTYVHVCVYVRMYICLSMSLYVFAFRYLAITVVVHSMCVIGCRTSPAPPSAPPSTRPSSHSYTHLGQSQSSSRYRKSPSEALSHGSHTSRSRLCAQTPLAESMLCSHAPPPAPPPGPRRRSRSRSPRRGSGGRRDTHHRDDGRHKEREGETARHRSSSRRDKRGSATTPHTWEGQGVCVL